MRNLRGKKALITGGASGLGRAIALKLAAAGSDVYLLDIDADGAARVAREAEALGVLAVADRCDVSQPPQISAAIAKLLDQWQTLDVLVNNAGVGFYGPTTTMTAEQWAGPCFRHRIHLGLRVAARSP